MPFEYIQSVLLMSKMKALNKCGTLRMGKLDVIMMQILAITRSFLQTPSFTCV